MNATWYLVANGSTARILRSQKGQHGLELVKCIEHPESRCPRKELLRDRPGVYRQKGSRPGSFSGSTDPKKHETEEFARQLADELISGALMKAFDRLVLVAPVPLISIVQERLTPSVRASIVHTICKDYTKVRESDLSGFLNRTLPFLVAGGG